MAAGPTPIPQNIYYTYVAIAEFGKEYRLPDSLSGT
jgi:hypothetical protein